MLDQSGIIENVNYDRYNVRSNVARGLCVVELPGPIQAVYSP